ncbi:hypothetical protein GYMLUDRAFT_718421 [Collybiopsis luxurians FD-317 M1]|nr:hypothetical protein GYMLUDRAFT_718421 [Collybiopsis luxurians FD-317 M1]
MPDVFTGTLAGIWTQQEFGFFAMIVVLMCLLSVLLYGAYIVLFVYSAYVLYYRGRLQTRNSRLVLFALTCVMFCMVTGYNVINLVFTLLGLRHISIVPPANGGNNLDDFKLDAPLPIQGTNLASVRTAFAGWTFIFGDAVIVWRAWALWIGSRKIILIPGFFLFGTTVTTLVSFGLDVNPLNVSSNAINDISIASWCFSLATSFTSTLLIAFKGWQYDVFKKTDVDVSNGPPPNRTQVARIMALIIESGALYCLVWITIIFTEFIKVPVLSKVTHVVILTIPIGVQLAGIYPTMIIILVSHQLSVERTMQTSASVTGRNSDIKFVSQPTSNPDSGRRAARVDFLDANIESHDSSNSQFGLSSYLQGEPEMPTRKSSEIVFAESPPSPTVPKFKRHLGL